MDDMLRIGVIANTHGIKGEVKVFPTTDDINRYKQLKEVILDTGKEHKKLEIENIRFFKQMVIVKFKGIDTINDIEKYKGKDILVTREQAIPLEEDEYFIYDIIGAAVITEEGRKIGTLEEVLQTGANDVFVVTSLEGKELLFPVIQDCVREINIEEKKVIIHVMKGLLEES